VKVSVKRKINFLVTATAFCAFLINIILAAVLKDVVLIWVVGIVVTIFVAYILSEMSSRGIVAEMENFLEFTKRLPDRSKGKAVRTFYDDLLLEAAKNVDVCVQSLNANIRKLTEKEKDVETSLKLLERCSSDIKNAYNMSNSERKKSGAELAKIADQLEKTKDSFRNIKSTFSGTTESLKGVIDTATRISLNAGDLHKVVSETSSSVGEMSELISDEIQLVDHAKTFTGKAAEAANEGGKVVSKAVAGMNRIVETVKKNAVKISDLGKSSDEIGEIIATIDEIADQTNLLALNAAIEAARAGEQGRGFAVVADEIRKLAERTTKATKEIANTINAMQEEIKAAVSSMEEGTEEVEKGVTLTDESGRVLNKIVEAIDRTNDIMAKVDNNAKNQSVRSADIKNSTQRICNITQDFSINYDAEKGQDLLSEKINLLNTWIESGEASAQDMNIAYKGLTEAMERMRSSYDSVTTLENRMSEIMSQMQTGKDSIDQIIDGDSSDE